MPTVVTRPLFILQPPCAERLNCRECRDPNNATYREAWAKRYEMPPGWPNCYVGYPMGYQGPPPPVEPSALGIVVDAPESAEAKDLMERVRARADSVRPICENCPSRCCMGVSEDGLIVDCAVGFTCCGGGLSRGTVYLGSGVCRRGHWPASKLGGA